MMRRSLFLLCLLLVNGPAAAQSVTLDVQRVLELLPVPSVLRNSVTNLHANGDSLWAGPFLNLTTDGGASWFVADAESLLGTRNRVFSMDIEDEVIWVGLGYSSAAEGTSGTVPAAGGFLYSLDGGHTFTFTSPQLDLPGDSVEVYGVSALRALPIIVEQQSPPYDIDYDAATGDVWVAAWASGIRRSSDRGRNWQRVVLPPDDLTEIHPDEQYDFEIAPRRGASSGHLNHMGFAVLVDETGTVWAGTPAGVNRSTDGGLSWRRFSHDGTTGGLTGSWVISIEEQPIPGRNPIWMATWNAGEAGESGRFGITVTRDGGESFEQVLVGERIYDFAFRGANTVYAAGEAGLFISDDGGITWNVIRSFADAARPDRVVRPDINVYAVATTRGALWVGTSDGLLRSSDGGRTWRVFRAEVPLHPTTPTASVPDVDTYAYPNPFSPSSDRFVRIRYELDPGGTVDLRIFDFGMNLVRVLVDGAQMAGVREVTWDGTDDNGIRVANGVYFYSVRAGGSTFRGKIQVLE